MRFFAGFSLFKSQTCSYALPGSCIRAAASLELKGMAVKIEIRNVPSCIVGGAFHLDITYHG